MATPISVIITCFNLERYIGAAIQSVLSQDWNGHPEIIVVDDCSTDGSTEIIQSFGGVRRLPMATNSGVLLAMLAGIEASTGELLFFLDGDDVWEHGKLSEAKACFDADRTVGFVTHDLSYMDADGNLIDRMTRPQQAMGAVTSDRWSDTLRDGILSLGEFIWFGSAFAVRRSLAELEQFAGWARTLPDPRNTYQDWPLAYWVAALPNVRLGYVPSKLFRYRLHDLNYSGDARTAARAVRNFRRSLNTVIAMKDIAVRRRLGEAILSTLDGRIQFYDYLIDLNSGQRAKAVRGFVRSLAYLRARNLMAKEAMRFVAIQILGPDHFARLVTRRAVLRDLPVS